MISRNYRVSVMATAGLGIFVVTGCHNSAANSPTSTPMARPAAQIAQVTQPSTTITDYGDVQVALGDKGVSSIKYAGQEFVWSNPGDATGGEFDGNTFWVHHVVLKKAGASEQTVKSGGPSQVQTDPEHNSVTRTFAWGRVNSIFTAQGNTLNISVRVRNTTPDTTINSIYIQPTWLQFPSKPKEYDGNTPMLASNYGTPSVINTDYGSGDAVLCNQDVTKPLIIGYPYAQNKPQSTNYPILIASRAHESTPSQLWPYLDRPIGPGQTDTYYVSLRFGPAGARATDLAADIYKKFSAVYPYQLKWPDRRPIGYMVLSTTVPHPPGGKNPRGWFGNDASVDITTPTGLAELRKRILDEADGAIKLLKDMDAQGVITWDIEGQEFPHATSYVGDPTEIKERAPEMDPIADAYFKKFRDAGLRIGVCLRPQKLIVNGGGANQTEVPDPAATLNAKIAYAKKRWGCTIFYVDSNGDPNAPFDVNIFKKVTEANPDVLIMPEHQNTAYYAYTAPYDELSDNLTSTPEYVQRVYPQAFEVINTATDHQGGPLADKRAELVAAVKRGDILLFRTWYNTPEYAQVKSIYEEAKGKGNQ